MSGVFRWSRAAAIARKEVCHVRRDPFTLGMALGLPILMVVVYGLAIEFNVRNVALSVSDSDKTQSSRRLIEAFSSSGYFRVRPAQSPQAAVQGVGSEAARACLIIPPRFEKDLLNGRTGPVQVLLDGADGSTVGPIASYLGLIQTAAAKRLADFDPPKSYELRTRFLFNPELNSRWFVIPGLVVVVMGILSILLTALTVAREWENGSMELLLSTPVEPLEIIAGKLAPYAALSLLAMAFVYVIARSVFGVPFAGNFGVFLLGCALFLVTYLAQGLFISVTVRRPVVAYQMSMLSGMLPVNLLSGFIFPIASMPLFFRYLTFVLPARWFMEISRGSFLRGAGFLELGAAFTALAVSCALLLALATRRFKRDLE